MNFNEALKSVKTDNCIAVALNDIKKEVFIIEYDENLENFTDTIVYYYKDLEGYSGVEESYSPTEFLEEFPDYRGLEFNRMNKEGLDALCEIWESMIAIIKRNLIK
jgi:hypothetical protein